MYLDKKVVVVLPAYNAEKTLTQTWEEIPFDIVDELILCDDASRDGTFELAQKLGIHHVIRHPSNMGYGANQKTLYDKALEIGRHRHHVASRLSVHTQTDTQYGQYHCPGTFPCGPRFQNSRQGGFSRRNALLQIRFQPISDPDPKFSD